MGVPRNGSPKPPKGARPSPNAQRRNLLLTHCAALCSTPTHASWIRGHSLFAHRLRSRRRYIDMDGSRGEGGGSVRTSDCWAAQLRT